MAVRKPPDWLRQVDERILEYLEAETKATPLEMSESGVVTDSNSYISQRLKLLIEIGLVHRVSQGQYKITSEGIGFLAGQEDLRDVEEPS